MRGRFWWIVELLLCKLHISNEPRDARSFTRSEQIQFLFHKWVASRTWLPTSVVARSKNKQALLVLALGWRSIMKAPKFDMRPTTPEEVKAAMRILTPPALDNQP